MPLKIICLYNPAINRIALPANKMVQNIFHIRFSIDELHRLTINGYPAFTTHKNGMSTVVCTLDDWSSVLTVTGKGFSVDDLAQVAEGVQVR